MVYGGKASGKDPFGKAAEGSQEWEAPKEVIGGVKAQQASSGPLASPVYLDEWDAPQEEGRMGDNQSYEPRKGESSTTEKKSGKQPLPGRRK